MSLKIYAGGLLKKWSEALLGSHYIHVYSYKAVIWFEPMKPQPIITYVNQGNGRFAEATDDEHYAKMMVDYRTKGEG